MNLQRIIAAEKEFSPIEMMKYLKRSESGVVYFDRSKKVIDPESGARFYYMLNGDYNAGWNDVDNLTAYFEVVGDEIIAGGYNIRTGQKTSRRRLISTDEYFLQTPYTYRGEEIKKMQEIILKILNQ